MKNFDWPSHIKKAFIVHCILEKKTLLDYKKDLSKYPPNAKINATINRLIKTLDNHIPLKFRNQGGGDQKPI